MAFAKRKIIEIVNDNYICASLLDVYGIEFYRYPEHTLQQVCQERKMDLSLIANKLMKAKNFYADTTIETLEASPISKVIEYLKNTHRLYVRYKLPYIARLIQNIDLQLFDCKEVAQDLKFIFPHFQQEFTAHILEEENKIFSYIQRLQNRVNNGFDLIRAFYDIEHNEIAAVAKHHLEDDDDMAGIRELTDNYAVNPCTGIYTKTLYAELLAFETDLKKHAQIENKVLFPKAICLENTLKQRIEKKARWN
jgi:regulator of cell morphogenesis and NO signaling